MLVPLGYSSSVQEIFGPLFVTFGVMLENGSCDAKIMLVSLTTVWSLKIEITHFKLDHLRRIFVLRITKTFAITMSVKGIGKELLIAARI